MSIPCWLIQRDPGSRWDHPNLWKRESLGPLWCEERRAPIPEKSKENLGKKRDLRHIPGQGRDIAAAAPAAPGFVPE